MQANTVPLRGSTKCAQGARGAQRSACGGWGVCFVGEAASVPRRWYPGKKAGTFLYGDDVLYRMLSHTG